MFTMVLEMAISLVAKQLNSIYIFFILSTALFASYWWLMRVLTYRLESIFSMKKIICLAGLFLLSSCTSNMVKLGVYQNKAQLIATDGSVFTGNIIINQYTNDGDVVFETSPYGKLTGKWTATSHGSHVIKPASNDVPVNGAEPVLINKTYLGKTFLTANGKVVLHCDFKANIEGEMLLGSVFVIGDGACLDDQKQTLPIQFFKS